MTVLCFAQQGLSANSPVVGYVGRLVRVMYDHFEATAADVRQSKRNVQPDDVCLLALSFAAASPEDWCSCSRVSRYETVDCGSAVAYDCHEELARRIAVT